MENPGGYKSVSSFPQDVKFSSVQANRNESMVSTTVPYMIVAVCLCLYITHLESQKLKHPQSQSRICKD